MCENHNLSYNVDSDAHRFGITLVAERWAMFGEIIFAVVGRIWEALTTFEFSPDMALSGRAWAFIARLKFVASSSRLPCEIVFAIAPDATDNGR